MAAAAQGGWNICGCACELVLVILVGAVFVRQMCGAVVEVHTQGLGGMQWWVC